MNCTTGRITTSFAIVLALAVVGCGSSDNNGTGGTGGSTDVPLRILVTNDDGFQAEGINAIVEALLGTNPNDEIVVCAPDMNRSGSSDMTNCGTLDAFEGETLGGYPATSVDGCPADAVNYALDNLYPAEDPPDVVLSGINDQQNVGNITIGEASGLFSQTSGTIGAAKTAARSGVPALASSQGTGDPVDFPAGVAEVLLWLSEHRAALAEGSVSTTNIDSLNIPSCNQGSIRNPLDPLEVPLATENPNGFGLIGPQDCQREGVDPDTDVNAFFTGWVTLTSVPAN